MLVSGLAKILAEPRLSDLLINGCDAAYADTGAGLRQVVNPFNSETELQSFARECIAAAAKHVDFATPAADATLEAQHFGLADNSRFRVHVVLASAVTPNTLISIRKHRAELLRLCDFAGQNLELELWLNAMVGRRENFLISGATGSGKTSLLKTLMANLPGERIVAIEDAGELKDLSAHSVALQARQPNTEGRGAITLDWLLQQALRMRPDRIVLGEVRGVELLTLLGALNTGHSGAAASIHANSVSAVASRVETIGLQAGWPPRALATSFASAVQWVIHLQRGAEGQRMIAEIGKTVIGPNHELQVVPYAYWA